MRLRDERALLLRLILIALCTLIVLNLLPKREFESDRRYSRLAQAHNVSPVNVVEEDHIEEAIRNLLDGSGDLPSNRTHYEPRSDMGKCEKAYGNVVLFVGYVKESMETHYRVAQQSLECYLKGTNYTVLMVDLLNDKRVKAMCGHHQQLFFKKHCSVAAYLNESDWMLVLDADTGVVNPNHCIEEYIDDRVDILFYERFFNWEIASGNYLIRNSNFSHNFLIQWSKYEWTQPQNWNGADNGVLQMLILQTVIPSARQEIENCDHIWHQGTNYETYMNFVTCCKIALGANRLWPGKIRIYRRAHGWVRDGFLTSDRFCSRDFMLHGWKGQAVGANGWQSPFKKNLNPALCGIGYGGWDYRERAKTSCKAIRVDLANFEKSTGKAYPKVARTIPYLQLPDVGVCYPNCEEFT